jgi:hypothetical protein
MKNQEQILNEIKIAVASAKAENYDELTEDLIFDVCCDVAFDSGLYEETNDNWYNEIYVPTLEEFFKHGNIGVVLLSNLKNK